MKKLLTALALLPLMATALMVTLKADGSTAIAGKLGSIGRMSALKEWVTLGFRSRCHGTI